MIEAITIMREFHRSLLEEIRLREAFIAMADAQNIWEESEEEDDEDDGEETNENVSPPIALIKYFLLLSNYFQSNGSTEREREVDAIFQREADREMEFIDRGQILNERMRLLGGLPIQRMPPDDVPSLGRSISEAFAHACR